MSCSEKRSGNNILGAAGLAVFTVLAAVFSLFPEQALAAPACPATEVVEGGKHCVFTVSGKGQTHVWMPGGYNAATAGTVIYVHGDTTTADAKDSTWDQDKLPVQFKASNVNALFIAPSGPHCGCPAAGCCSDSTIRWTSLTDLLAAVGSALGTSIPSGPLEVIGHSNAIRTTTNPGWLDHPNLNFIIGLDTMYGGTSSYIDWLKTDGHRIIMVGKNTATASKKVVKSVPAGKYVVSTAAIPASYAGLPEAEKAAKALYLDSGVGHHEMPETYIKSLASFAFAGAAPPPATPSPSPAPQGAGTAPTPAGGTVPLEASTLTVPLANPKLEIPIPELTLDDASIENGIITIPYLGQYIAGVYRFLVSIVGALAASVIMIGGFQFLTAGGDKSKVDAAIKRIRGAVLGLVIVLCSYAMLYAINPDLVNFKAFQIMTVDTQLIENHPEVGLEGLDPTEQQAVATEQASSGQTRCGSDSTCLAMCKTFDCRVAAPATCTPDIIRANAKKKVGAGPIANYYCGMICDDAKIPNSAPGFPLFKVQDELNAAGAVRIKAGGSVRATREAITGLLAIDQELQKEKWKEYSITVSNCFRDYKTGIKIGCTSLIAAEAMEKADAPDLAEKFYYNVPAIAAYPGSSPHGFGYACDMSLSKGSEQLIVINGDLQCQAKYKANVALFDEIVFPTHAQRYYGEIWHYEWGNPNKQSRCGTDMGVACVWPPPPCRHK